MVIGSGSSLKLLKLPKKIVITGPESSGKSTLSKLLAKEFGTSYLEEYARTYIETLDRPYQFEDVLTMAKEQLRQEKELDGKLIFLDTDLTVYAIWIKEKYKQEIDWIEDHLNQAKAKIYLLCAIDVEWEDDPLREHPKQEDRQRLLDHYKTLLEKHKLTYHIISGDIPTRLEKCKEIIDNSI
jgi:nicotinamide riboside kinase